MALGAIDDVQLGKLLALQSRVEQRSKRPPRRETPMPSKRPIPDGVALGAIALKRVASKAARGGAAPPLSDDAPRAPEPLAANAAVVSAKPVPMALPRKMATKKEEVSETTRWLQATLGDATYGGASDVLLQPGRVVRLRRFGRLHDLTTGPVSADACETLLAECLDVAARDDLARDGHVTFVYDAGDAGRFRVNVFHAHGGCSGVFHRVPAEPPTLAALGLPSALAKLTTFSNGLVLVSGPTCSGKSSTVAALVHLINEERDDHILSIERPVECVHNSRVGLVSQLEIGRDAATTATALRSVMREDADVVVVDPLDEADAVVAALAAADGGQLVIATLATRSAVRAIEYLVDAYPPAQQAQACAWLATALRAVVSQRLLPATDDQSTVVALEVVYVDDAIRRAIRERRLEEIPDAVRTSHLDSCLLDDSLTRLLRGRQISLDVARANAHHPHNFRG